MPKTKQKSKTRMNKSTRKKPSLRSRIFAKLKPTRKSAAIVTVVAFAAVGAILYLQSQAGTCGATVANYNYKVPFGKAIWNQPICGMPRHPQSADYVSRFFNWSNVNDGSPAADVNNGKIRNNPGYPNPTFFDPEGLVDLYTREIYYASKSNKTRQVQTNTYFSNLDGDDALTPEPKTPIPWNDSWRAGVTRDGEMMILDDRVGTEGYGRMYKLSSFNNVILPNGKVYAGSVDVARDLNGNYASYVDYEGFIKDRGVGLSFYATLTMPDEVAAGEIRHALGVAIPNTAYGPACEKSQLGFVTGNWSQEGKTCGTAISPATKFEQKDKRSAETIPQPTRSLYTPDKTIPEGMLFALNVTYEQIDAWIKSRPDLVSNPRKAETARIFARAMKDYGMMITDTNGGGPSIQTAGGINPDNAKKWTDLGMGPNDKAFTNDMFRGLITESNLYVVDPPVAECLDGTKSKYYCDWKKVSYTQDTRVTTASTNTPPSVTITTPAANAPIVGLADISASVSGQNPITNVQFTIGGTTLATDTAAPYVYRFDSKSLKNGPQTITVKATDNKNLSTTRTITVNVNNPPPANTTTAAPPSPPGKLERSLRPDVTKFRYVLDLSWTAPQSTAGIREYQVTRTGGKTPLAQTTKTTRFTDSSLEAGVRYSYSVVAVDNTGRRSLPSSVSAKGNCLLIWCSLE